MLVHEAGPAALWSKRLHRVVCYFHCRQFVGQHCHRRRIKQPGMQRRPYLARHPRGDHQPQAVAGSARRGQHEARYLDRVAHHV